MLGLTVLCGSSCLRGGSGRAANYCMYILPKAFFQFGPRVSQLIFICSTVRNLSAKGHIYTFLLMSKNNNVSTDPFKFISSILLAFSRNHTALHSFNVTVVPKVLNICIAFDFSSLSLEQTHAF